MLLVAAYYNIFGKWYYVLITQGGPGEGDKDTFIPAALALNESFYVVEKLPEPLGWRGNGAAVLQFGVLDRVACELARREGLQTTLGGNSRDDINRSKERRNGSKESKIVKAEADLEIEENTEIESGCDPQPLFLHASWQPKLNALRHIRKFRQLGSEENTVQLFGYDVEKVTWGYMVEMACEGEIIEEEEEEEVEVATFNFDDIMSEGDREGLKRKRAETDRLMMGEEQHEKDQPTSKKDSSSRHGSNAVNERGTETRNKNKRACILAQGLNLGKLEFRDWGDGNKSATGVCLQTRTSFKNMFGKEYVFSADEEQVDGGGGNETLKSYFHTRG
ncbi:hypothetical protein EG329_011887 [Mollisiaceae sp. DMI_Dod_QoI]|nr:hypothetical protein EG329_011887 [Helotiales sp. DMI_Dod_QoI]